MASSRSFRKGQIPSSCKLCEVETKISWKCLDCNIIMCNRCKEKIHPNLRNAENHKMVDIKEIGQTEDVDFNNIPCKKHKGQVCVMFCQECDKLVCPKCMAQIHNGHKFVEISEGYQSRIQKLKVKQDQMKVKTKKIKEIKKSENAKRAQAKKMIEAHILKLKTAVDEYGEILKKELDEDWETLLGSIEKEEGKVTAMEDTKKDRTSLIEDIIQSKDVETIFEMGNQLDTSLEHDDEPAKFNFTAMPSFIPGEISINNVGSLLHTSDITLQVIKEYTTDISGVLFMSSIDDKLWITNQDVLQNVKPGQTNLKIISSFDVKNCGMAVTPSNNLLIAPFRESVLKQISEKTNKITDTDYSVHPLVLTTFHVTNNGKIIVGARSPGEPFPVTGRRAVIIMDKKGKHQTIYENDRNNQRIFTHVDSITTTNNGNIFVVDGSSSDWQGRVVILGQDGNIINRYKGHLDVNTEEYPFKPVSIVTTPSDNVIVIDMDTHTIHILNNTGHLISHISTKNIGIKFPYCLTFTMSAQVYIGCTRTKGSTNNAKLYEVKLLGC